MPVLFLMEGVEDCGPGSHPHESVGWLALLDDDSLGHCRRGSTNVIEQVRILVNVDVKNLEPALLKMFVFLILAPAWFTPSGGKSHDVEFRFLTRSWLR